MLVIGVTGGIGTGKSEVSRALEGHGAIIIDADRVGHSIYLLDTDGWKEVVATFGEDVLQEDRQVDRRKLGAIVFGDPEALAKLNAITHPKIRQRISDLTEEERHKGSKVVVVEAAILIEANWIDLVDEVWVATSDPNAVVRRIQERNNLAEDQIRSRIASQMTHDERVRHATVIIENDGDLEGLREQVAHFWEIRVGG